MAISALPVLTYFNVRCAPVLEITIFATARHFLIQTPRTAHNEKGGISCCFHDYPSNRCQARGPRCSCGVKRILYCILRDPSTL